MISPPCRRRPRKIENRRRREGKKGRGEEEGKKRAYEHGKKKGEGFKKQGSLLTSQLEGRDEESAKKTIEEREETVGSPVLGDASPREKQRHDGHRFQNRRHKGTVDFL